MTDRTHYRIFNERTGNPVADNSARHTNRAMSRYVRDSFRVNAWGRRRKKALTKTTLMELFNLHLAVMKQLHDAGRG